MNKLGGIVVEYGRRYSLEVFFNPGCGEGDTILDIETFHIFKWLIGFEDDHASYLTAVQRTFHLQRATIIYDTDASILERWTRVFNQQTIFCLASNIGVYVIEAIWRIQNRDIILIPDEKQLLLPWCMDNAPNHGYEVDFKDDVIRLTAG